MNLVVMVLLAFFGMVLVGELGREFCVWVSQEWNGLVYAYCARTGRTTWA